MYLELWSNCWGFCLGYLIMCNFQLRNLLVHLTSWYEKLVLEKRRRSFEFASETVDSFTSDRLTFLVCFFACLSSTIFCLLCSLQFCSCSKFYCQTHSLPVGKLVWFRRISVRCRRWARRFRRLTQPECESSSFTRTAGQGQTYLNYSSWSIGYDRWNDFNRTVSA